MSHFASTGRFRKAGLRDRSLRIIRRACGCRETAQQTQVCKGSLLGCGERARPLAETEGGGSAGASAADRVSARLLQRVRAEPATGRSFFPDVSHVGTSVGCVPPSALKVLYLSFLKI